MKGDEALLRPYEAEMEFDQLPDTPRTTLSRGESEVLGCRQKYFVTSWTPVIYHKFSYCLANTN